MRSWILRHRLRLRLIYGPGPDPGEAAPQEGEAPTPGALFDADGARVPGRMRRSEDGLELVPMPRRVGRTRRVG